MSFKLQLVLFFAVSSTAAFGEANAQESTLIEAYKKEFAFLEAEKVALKKRLSEMDDVSEREISTARGAVSALQQQILGLRARADEIETALEEVDAETATAKERSDLLSETIERAFETLTRFEMEVPKKAAADIAEQSEQIEIMFAFAGKVLSRAGTIRTERGRFFDKDGALDKGQIVRVGNIAAYGISDKNAGTLAPAGAGRFKLWPEDAAVTARTLADGKNLDALAIFLFESLEKGVEEKREKTPLEVIESGGIIAWVIVALGGLGLVMMLLRILILMRAGSRTERLLRRLKDALSSGTPEEASAVCRNAKGAAARVLDATVSNLRRERTHLEDIVSEAILHEVPFIERFGGTILVIAAVAPLLGLLGTVTGMISTFDVITEYGTGDPKMLSGGISEALVTTELGLIVAIPALLFGTLLSGRANAILQTLERAALQIMNLSEQPDVRERMAATSKNFDKPRFDKTAPTERSSLQENGALEVVEDTP